MNITPGHDGGPFRRACHVHVTTAWKMSLGLAEHFEHGHAMMTMSIVQGRRGRSRRKHRYLVALRGPCHYDPGDQQRQFFLGYRAGQTSTEGEFWQVVWKCFRGIYRRTHARGRSILEGLETQLLVGQQVDRYGCRALNDGWDGSRGHGGEGKA